MRFELRRGQTVLRKDYLLFNLKRGIKMHDFGRLLFDIARNFALIGILAYLLFRLPAVRRTCCWNYQKRPYNQLIILSLIFGAFSALGNWIGIPVLGATANMRIVGPIVGGLLGGPFVGVVAGGFGAIPRYLFGGFNAWASIAGNIAAGLVSGMVHRQMGPYRINVKVALGTAVLCEFILKFLILTFSKPFEQALALEKVAGLPTLLANSLAVSLFIYIIKDLYDEQQKTEAQAMQKTIEVLKRIGDFSTAGLNEKTAHEIAQMIYGEQGSAAVALSDAEKVLAFIGDGADHHSVGSPIDMIAVTHVIREGRMLVLNSKDDIGCPDPDCPLSAVVIAPIVVGTQTAATLALFKTGKDVITSYETGLVTGISDFLSSKLAQQKIEEQRSLLSQAEYNMLKAQVSPHFLFNTLSTIKALTATDPAVAQALIKDLAGLLRSSIDTERAVTTVEENLDTVSKFFRIVKARFGEKVSLVVDVPAFLLPHPIPVFTLQPLVENAVHHGISQIQSAGCVKITGTLAAEDNCVLIQVEDNGKGIPAAVLPFLLGDRRHENRSNRVGIGIRNVDERIKKLFGPGYGLSIESEENAGTIISIRLPYERKP